MENFRSFLADALTGREVDVSVLASQVISNAPAALLLSCFAQDWEGVRIGCNLGGLGTPIVSMASLWIDGKGGGSRQNRPAPAVC